MPSVFRPKVGLFNIAWVEGPGNRSQESSSANGAVRSRLTCVLTCTFDACRSIVPHAWAFDPGYVESGPWPLPTLAKWSDEMAITRRFVHDARRFDAGEALVEALESEGELFVIEAEQREEGGVEIAHADFVHGGFVADVVGLAVVARRPSRRRRPARR